MEKRLLKITVCELPNRPGELSEQWRRLCRHTRSARSDLVLLPEMPFHPWLAASQQPDPERWQQAVDTHRQWLARLPELNAATVIGTRPVIRNNQPFNEGFVWSSQAGAVRAHTKYYLPEETGFWEASWYRRGAKTFAVVQCGEVTVGFLICTEMWFGEHARDYGKQGAHIIVCPRATPAASSDKWLAGGRTAAVVSGAYCISSNLSGTNDRGNAFGGTGWIIEPEEGAVLETTSSQNPFVTMDIDPAWAERAKTTYPRYVSD
jgi:N-carbamoylputrescine amidase